jgi:hypothetical protein
MTRVTWDSLGERLFHTGVDRGMLYIGDDAVAWNGLASVTEAPSGGDVQSYFVDGQKVLGIPTVEDFAATIEAYSAPVEFAPCAGRAYLSQGLYAADQPKKTFAFSYRTLIGNDVVGSSLAYKIHIVYNALAQISDFAHTTKSDSPSVQTRSWDITSVPVSSTGFKPVSHFVVDTRINTAGPINDLEDILYGTDDDEPRLPTMDELSDLFTYEEVAWWDLTGLSDFPGGAVAGDAGVDFGSDDMYVDIREIRSAFWWDLTGLSDFPDEAPVGDWGIDTFTGDVFKKIEYAEITWWDLTGLSDFPGGAVAGDAGIDFASDNLYADITENEAGFLWDLTGLDNFPYEAPVGDWGVDTTTGSVYEKEAPFLSNDFEEGTDGVTMTTANSAGTGENAFEVLTNPTSGQTIMFKSDTGVHGTNALELATGATAATVFFRWTTSVGSQSDVWCRFLFKTGSTPASNTRIWHAYTASGDCASIIHTTAGKLIYANSSGTQYGSMITDAALALNTYIRIELYIKGDATAGIVGWRIYLDPEGLVPDDVKSESAVNTTGLVAKIEAGNAGATKSNSGPWRFKDFAIGIHGYLGP